jgi:hypothetical protein
MSNVMTLLSPPEHFGGRIVDELFVSSASTDASAIALYFGAIRHDYIAWRKLLSSLA